MSVQSTDWFPMDDAQHRAQMRGLDRLLSPGARALDVGCGSGRVAGPLARSGRKVVGLDADAEAVAACGAVWPEVEVYRRDVLTSPLVGEDGGMFDAALCLGHTFMMFHDPIVAAGLLRRVHERVVVGGMLVLDDFGPLWAEVAEGNWQTGASEDGSMQIVWAAGDNVLAMRRGGEVDESCWSVRERDRLLRLWSMGEIRLLAAMTGWSEPHVRAEDALIVLTRAG